DTFMIVAVDDFNMGAMENKGLNVFNSKYVLASQETATDMDYLGIEGGIAHEYFHNWTGNRVTCRDWFQLSLKGGLTNLSPQQMGRRSLATWKGYDSGRQEMMQAQLQRIAAKEGLSGDVFVMVRRSLAA
ncbi:MAG: aminopeptidase N C-terminal domain-containing protein, partial [Proteobacteria bacterium]|nr:aminopeptidase N C-terminal domain-containing protein [Pseudomonadota bacterium]